MGNLHNLDIKAVLKSYEGYYKSAVDAKHHDDRTWEERLRVSSFPYCPLKHAYKRLTQHETAPETDMEGMYYTSVGTVTHEIIQDFVGRGGKMYGQWKCSDKACAGFRALSSKNICPKCGSRMLYEELTVRAYKNVSGHIDGVWRDPDGKYWIVDYKTCSARIIESQHIRRTLPYSHNKAQIRAYCALVERNFSIKIAGWILMYVARDSPTKVMRAEGAYMSEESKKKYLANIRKWDRQWDEVLEIKSLKQLLAIKEAKPCTDHEFYDKHYETFTPCPLSKGGVCFQPKRLNELLRLVWCGRPKL